MEVRWPVYKMARDLAGTVLPVSEAVILAAAPKPAIRRRLGWCIVFSPEDVPRLYEELLCPSSSSVAQSRLTGSSAAPSAASALKRALELTTAASPRRSERDVRPRSLPSRSTVVA